MAGVCLRGLFAEIFILFSVSVTFWLILEKMIILVKIPGKKKFKNVTLVLLYRNFLAESASPVCKRHVKKTLRRLFNSKVSC